MLRRCMSTVRGLRKSSRAISRLFARPRPGARTSSSRLDSPPAAEVAGRRRRPRCRSACSPRAARSTASRAASGLAPSRRAVRCAATSRSTTSSPRPAATSRSGSTLRLGALEGCTRVRNQLQRAIELLRRRLWLALEQRDLAERVRERRQRLCLPGVGRDRRQRRCAGLDVPHLLRLGEDRRGPTQRGDRIVPLLGFAPTLEQRATALPRSGGERSWSSTASPQARAAPSLRARWRAPSPIRAAAAAPSRACPRTQSMNPERARRRSAACSVDAGDPTRFARAPRRDPSRLSAAARRSGTPDRVVLSAPARSSCSNRRPRRRSGAQPGSRRSARANPQAAGRSLRPRR
jgi:hypothetical protein